MKFCSQCGSAMNPSITCPSCQTVHYQNPKPVAVGCVPVVDEQGNFVGLLGVKRGIEPRKGQWAFPGGFVDLHENMTQASAREIFEETELALGVSRCRIVDERCTPDGKTVLVFVEYPAISEKMIKNIQNEETEEVGVLKADTDMAFPLHKQVLDALIEKHQPQATRPKMKR